MLAVGRSQHVPRDSCSDSAKKSTLMDAIFVCIAILAQVMSNHVHLARSAVKHCPMLWQPRQNTCALRIR
jgi:hypothetical protein